MKKSNIKYILLGILLVFTIGIATLNSFNVKADSGWDSDYDSGWDSDWDSGSSWDSDWGSSSSYHSYSGGGGSGSSSFSGFVAFLIIIAVVVYVMSKSKGSLPSGSSNRIFSFISEDEIRKLLPDFNKEEFLIKSYQTFLDVQNAWSEFDYDALRKYLSDELFNTYKSQLKVLSAKKQKNIMTDFTKIDINTTRAYQNEGKTTIEVELIVSFYDYVVDKDNNVVRGQKTRKLTNDYLLTFISSKQVKNKSNKCPNCNAPLDNVASNKCPYCRSTIVSEHYDWVLSKKEIKKR